MNTPPASIYHTRVCSFEKSSPYRLRNPPMGKKKCNRADSQIYEDPHGPDSSAEEDHDVDTPSKHRVRSSAADTKQKGPAKSSPSMDKNQVRQQSYCTQACLLGLARQGPLDQSCPNVNAHRVPGSDHHALRRKQIAEFITNQLAVNPENGCEPLGKQGTRGALFKLVMKSYEYSFVAKGTVFAFKAHLQYENSIYRRLSQIQGTLIPVCFGSASLIRP